MPCGRSLHASACPAACARALLRCLLQVPMSTIVTDLVFVGSRLLAAARDTNMLRMWQLPGVRVRLCRPCDMHARRQAVCLPLH